MTLEKAAREPRPTAPGAATRDRKERVIRSSCLHTGRCGPRAGSVVVSMEVEQELRREAGG